MAINEVGRLVIVVPGVESSAGLGLMYVAVALEDREGVIHAESVTCWPDYAYALIGRVCEGRAVDTVGGALKVKKKVVTPEGYLKLWREALSSPVTTEEALARFGVTVTLVVGGNAVRQAGKKRQWTTDPMPGFDGWAQRHAALIKPDADGYFAFEMEMGAEDAYVTWEMMTGYRDHKDTDERNKREMRVGIVKAAGVAEGDSEVNSDSEQAQAALFD